MVDTEEGVVDIAGAAEMPFREQSMSTQREAFVRAARMPGANIRALCRAVPISPTTGYKWLARGDLEDPVSFVARSRRPRTSPRQTPLALAAQVLALREAHPAWGGRKLRAALRRQGLCEVPAASTITAILGRHGRLDPAWGAGQPRAFQRFEHPYPNALWQMDFKGRLPCGADWCHPLTILDDHSRYSVGIAACSNQRTETVRAHLVSAFERYGLPERILVDNGSPWGDTWEHPYTPLTVWLLHLGIAVSHSRPYHPQTLGKDERFHGTLKRELASQLPFRDMVHSQDAFDAWRHLYNHERPHESLGDAVPADRYRPSPRRFPGSLLPLAYSRHDRVRKVQQDGWVWLHGRKYRLPHAFVGYPVGLRPAGVDGAWDVYFANTHIGHLDEHVR